jgi:hypothetical protein
MFSNFLHQGFVNPKTANLDALYALVSAFPFNPAVEEMFMISPVCLAIMLGKTARVV